MPKTKFFSAFKQKLAQACRSAWVDIKTMPALVKQSEQEIDNLRSLVGVAMLTALNVIINQFATIKFSPTLHLGFAFLTVGVSGMLYGPLLTGMAGLAADLIKYFLSGDGGFFPGFTLNEFILGFLFGIFLYRKKITLPRVFFAKLSTTLIINLCLTPLWLSMMYEDAFIALVSLRLVKNIVMLPIEVALLYIVCKTVQSLESKLLPHRK